MKKIIVVFGTRPEAIKTCPLILKLKQNKNLKCIVCLSGQHREMLSQVMDVFHVEADYNLDIMTERQSLGDITTKVLNGFDEILAVEKPDIVLVHGDTTTSFAAALSAFYRGIAVGHVEAGLRTYNMDNPFPEEFNRHAVDLISKVFFAPTLKAQENLLREGVDESRIFVTGNTVIDAMRFTINDNFEDENSKWAKDSKLILLTTHRRENWGLPMKHIFEAVRRLVYDHDEIKVIFPIHKNPDIQKLAYDFFGSCERIRIIDSVDAVVFHNYMSKAFFLMTDSGGVQEEATSIGKPVLVLRNDTERPEGIDTGTLRLVGTDEDDIYNLAKRLIEDEKLYNSMSIPSSIYGDGHASEKICSIIEKIEV